MAPSLGVHLPSLELLNSIIIIIDLTETTINTLQINAKEMKIIS